MRIVKIAFIGGESSGKTTTAKRLAEVLSLTSPTKYVPEYGRILGEFTGNVYESSDMLHIASVQVRMEDAAEAELTQQLSPQNPAAFVICDTTPLVTSFYARKWYDYVDPWLAKAAETRKYDYLFMCKRDFPHVNDGTRVGPEFSDEQEKYYRLHAVQPFVDLGGLTGKRVGDILQILLRDNLPK